MIEREPPFKRKVFAYITHNGRLLVFSQPGAPEVRSQVPAGTVEGDEPLNTAVMREAIEETGLSGLELVRPLGEQVCNVRNNAGEWETHHRYFYHLRCTDAPPTTWEHWERVRSDGGPDVLFSFHWVPLPQGIPPLTSDDDGTVTRLRGLFGDRPC